MTAEASKPEASQSPAPRRWVRLFAWLGFYYAFQIPLAPYIYHYWGLGEVFAGLNPYFFPSGLSQLILGSVFKLPLGLRRLIESDYVIYLVLFSGHVIYVGLLAATLAIRSRRVFRILMIILIVILTINVPCCLPMIPTSW